ncbi:hypothetical protein SAMN05216312_11638 [Cohnella sp. OV330]|uniref:hypothetical protein n=1 Tax=Cohnella sp. OV330 TaxID=1855288 RepID=UPI0008DFF9F4|nr:hypothetical protein [Cohnella sp. OV330]SFB59878.1 hypothetical protein SAMN05216312_11638 [Cohnella sp. OV330]
MVGSLTHWMEVALWVVLGSMAVDFLVGLFQSLQGNKLVNANEAVLVYLREIVVYVLPLFILAGIASMDETGWIVKTAYYIGAVAVVIKYLKDIKAKL